MMTLMLSNHPIQEVDLGYKPLASRIRFVLTLQEQLPTMLPLGSTGYDFSLTWISCVHVTTIRLRWGGIYCMIAKDLMGTGTPEEIRWSILLCSWSLIRMLSHSMTINFFWSLSPFILFLYISHIFRLVFFLSFSLFFSFLFSFMLVCIFCM